MIVSQPGILSSARRRDAFVSPYTWTSRTTGSTDFITGVAWNAGESSWAAVSAEVGANGDLLASADGITWTKEENNLAALRDIVSDGTTFCTVGSAGYMLTATDPTATWTSRTSSFGATNIEGVQFKNSLWLATGFSGKIATATSATGTWTQRTSNFGASTVRRSDWDGTYWVICGDGGKIGTSTNPVTTGFTVNGSANFGTTYVRDVAYSGDLSLWVAVGSSGKVGTAVDPTATWTQRSNPVAGSSIITSVVWDDTEDLFVAVTNASEIIISDDGIAWHLDSGGFVNMWGLGYGDGYVLVSGDPGVIKTSFS